MRSLTGFGVYELEPGEATWPYHFELNEEEWLIVVAGEVTLRTPDGERILRVGDVVCFPAGAAGAHAMRNDRRVDRPLRDAVQQCAVRRRLRVPGQRQGQGLRAGLPAPRATRRAGRLLGG